MKVALTGGTGFVGRHLTRKLLERGHKVVLLARGKNPGKDEFAGNDKVTFVAASLAQGPEMVRAIQGC
ncbi:MAG: NAD(P)-dependent oxidoreductase, partial [Vulcanimicrobiota bacterium]